MARYLFDGGEVVIDTSGNAIVNTLFTVWTDRAGGIDVTADMRAPDGVSAATVSTDSDGEIPYLRGPDGTKILYRDTGTSTRSPWYSAEAISEAMAGGGGGGVTVHGMLSGLGADDHQQYHNDARGDARYYTKSQADAATAAAATAQSANDRNRANHTGSQAESTVTNLVTDLNARAQFVTVSTGAEIRPAGSAIVVWVCPSGVDPANKIATDLVFTVTSGSSPADTTAPTIPTGVSSSSINSAGATISWTASTDAVGVTAYEVFANSVSKGTTATTSKVLNDLVPSTAYAVQVRARDAAGNWSALSTAHNFTTSASGGTVEHNVFGASAHPGTITKATDGPVKVVTGFYTFSTAANNWRSIGGRLYVPAGITMPTSAEFSLWLGNPPDLSTTPTRTATMTGITTGQWNEVRWSSPLTVTPSTPFWVGYRFTDGSYLAAASVGISSIQSANTTLLYEASASEFTNRSWYRYDTGTNGGTGGHWAIDVIVDEGP